MIFKRSLILIALLFVVVGIAYAEDVDKPVAKKATPVELMKKYADYIMVTKAGSSMTMNMRNGAIQIQIEGMAGGRVFSSSSGTDAMALLVSDNLIMYPHNSSQSGTVFIQRDVENDENDDNKNPPIKLHLPSGKDVTAKPVGAIKKLGLGFSEVDLGADAGVKKLSFGSTNVSVGQKVFVIGRRKSEWKYSMFYLRAEINGDLPIDDTQTAFSIDVPQAQLTDEALGAIVVDEDGNFLGIIQKFTGKSYSAAVVKPDFYADSIKKAIDTPDELDPYKDRANGIQGMVRELIPDMPQEDEEVEEEAKPFLGISVKAIDEETAKKIGLEEVTGLVIKTVAEDTPAAKAGLKVDDVILEADGIILQTSEELKLLISKHEPGEEMEFVIFRDGKQFTLKVTLGKK